MIKNKITTFLFTSVGVVALTGCSLVSAPSGYSSIEKQTVQELNAANYTPRSEDERAAILTQDLFAQATFWSREYDLNPADLEAAINLSNTLRRLGNPHQSIEVAQTTRALYPRDVGLMAELAAAHIATNNPKEALPIIDTALRQKPGLARLWSLKGAALDQFEQFAEARQHYSKGLSLDPNDSGIIANVGLSYALEGDPKTAELWLRRAASMPGASAGTRQNLSLVLGLQNKFDEAEKWARRDLDQQAVANNVSYIRSLRGSSVTPTNEQQPYRPTTQLTKTANYQQPQLRASARPSQTSRALNGTYQRPAKITTPAPRLTNYGQANATHANVNAVQSSRDAALYAAKAAAKRVKANSYKSPTPQQLAVAQPTQNLIQQNRIQQNLAPQNVLERISRSNLPKTEIAQRQRQHLAQRALTQQQPQQLRQPNPYLAPNAPNGVTPNYVSNGVTVTYPNTGNTQTALAGAVPGQTQSISQENFVSQPARQRRR